MSMQTNSLASEFIRLKIQLKQFANIELSPTELNFVEKKVEKKVEKNVEQCFEQHVEQSFEPLANEAGTSKKLQHLYQSFSLGVLEQQLILICLAA